MGWDRIETQSHDCNSQLMTKNKLSISISRKSAKVAGNLRGADRVNREGCKMAVGRKYHIFVVNRSR